MSWLERLTHAVFPKNQHSFLPKPPSIMAAGAPWYEEIGPSKQEVVGRIKKDIVESHPKLVSLDLEQIIENSLKDFSIGSYRHYYSQHHRDLVNEIANEALEIYMNRHQENMRLFYIIAMLKSKVRKVVEQFRARRRVRFLSSVEENEHME